MARYRGFVSSPRVPGGVVHKLPVDLRKALASHPEQFVQTLTEKLMTYGIGRTVTWRDMPTIRAIVRDTAKENYRFSSIILHIVDSDQFQMRSVAETQHPTQTAQNH